jgi:hypothetical protein
VHRRLAGRVRGAGDEDLPSLHRRSLGDRRPVVARPRRSAAPASRFPAADRTRRWR